MARYDVESPEKDYSGVTCKVRFYKGHAHVDEAENPAAVAYFRRRGYTLTEVREEQSEETPSEDTTPDKPKQADSKAVWVKYVVATTDLTEAEAEDLTKDELIELTENEEQA
ncbi:hypothetical protein [Nocardiopsis tropica]|uniref:Uncharacterized protein n=1 Tax=Nocardiopsis tropica TaxID=109330 RepID=A0ABU7KQW4_9ACTN|nr:hypothetical protein [Nocardiopsis umidischolae]MEE2051693.1 hypothetical protein [Nocardiopsis umidischolae]